MVKGPLVKLAFALALVLIIMSFAIALFPGYIEILGTVSAAVAVAVVAVLIFMLIRMRSARFKE